MNPKQRQKKACDSLRWVWPRPQPVYLQMKGAIRTWDCVGVTDSLALRAQRAYSEGMPEVGRRNKSAAPRTETS